MAFFESSYTFLIPVRRLTLGVGTVLGGFLDAVPYLATPVALVTPVVAVNLHAHDSFTVNPYIIYSHIWNKSIVYIWVQHIV